MTRFALFASAIAVFCTINCSNEDPVDNNPPLINSTSKELYSIYDTIAVNFSEDILELTEANYSTTPNLICSLNVARNSQVLCWGDTIRTSGLNQLKSDTTYSLTFSNISDGNNNIATTLSTSTQTTYFADLDYESSPATAVNDNYMVATSLSLPTIEGADTSWTSALINGLTIDDSISVSGYLGQNALLNYDNQDYYEIALRGSDTLSISLSDISFKVGLAISGPTPGTIIETQEFTQAGQFTFVANIDNHSSVASDLKARYPYWIRLWIKGDDNVSEFTKYTLSVKRTGHNLTWGAN
ncbi:MAG: hypothetical protein OCD01_20420 [Fibrobacterales bacterium]